MSEKSNQVWECEYQVEVHAPPPAIWSLMSDASSWARWNTSVGKLEMTGPFAPGTRIAMVPPDGTPIVTRLVEVRVDEGFLDETCIGDSRVFVDRRIEAIDAERTRVVFALEAFGPSCEEAGSVVSSDFPIVLKTLAEHAEALAGAAR